MSTEALWALGNLLACVLALTWLTYLLRSAQPQDSALLGIAGHYRLASYVSALALVALVYLLAIQQCQVSSSLYLILLLVGQLVALLLVDRWHRAEEKHQRGRVEMYSDLNGCLLLLGVAGLFALSIIPAVCVLVQIYSSGG